MKKYAVTMDYDGMVGYATLIVVARNVNSAINKAVRRLQYLTQDKSITGESVSDIEYLGFYLSRRFVSVK